MPKRNRFIAQEEHQPQVQHLSEREHRTIHPIGRQKSYIHSIKTNPVTICYGPPGTGKSLLACFTAFKMMANGDIDRFIYIKPDVGMEGQRPRGALPGNAFEKAWPLMGPLLDNMVQFMPRGQALYHLEKQEKVEVMLLEDLRGRSLDHSVVLLDESQNTLAADIKTFLTRMAEGSHMIVAGDPYQSDLPAHYRLNNGLRDAIHRFDNIEGVGIVELGKNEIMRHPFIGHILDRYEAA